MIPPLPADIFHQGQVLNNTYEIEGVLGRGGTGEVYRARNLVSGRVVAIKALSRQFSGNDDYVELMRREEQMRDISHDAVVRYTECSRSDDGNVFLVMDFIDGPSLQDELARRQMDPRELLIVAHRVGEGLVAAHRRGIVHRDLSPDNVVLRGGEPERATLIDFGIAKDTAAGARTIVGNDFAGKYEYAAPEQLEGRADARSDLYALGASLLAAFRGEVPFAGSTPGEIVRRKRQPLDTQGVPEPLKRVIERLAAPEAADRPASASEALGLIESALAIGTSRETQRTVGSTERRRSGTLAVAVALLIGAGGAALWATGQLDRVFAPQLPLASPYRLEATVVGGPALSGNAPDEPTATLLRTAFGTAAGVMPSEDTLVLAEGVPSDRWATGLADLLGLAGNLEDWTLEAQDQAVRISGLAVDSVARASVASSMTARAEASGLTLDLELEVGPQLLSTDRLMEALNTVATCGPLALANSSTEGVPLSEPIRVQGNLAATTDADRIRQTLAPLVGDLEVAIEASVLNESLCRVRNILPPLEAQGMSVRLTDGATGEPSLSGIFRVGSVPLADVELPAALEGFSLWVALVTSDGEVANLLPRMKAPETRVEALGQVEDGIRRIRVVCAEADAPTNPGCLVGRVSNQNFGKHEIFVFLSRRPLFEVRGRGESVESFEEALAKVVADQPDVLVGIASRLLETRP